MSESVDSRVIKLALDERDKAIRLLYDVVSQNCGGWGKGRPSDEWHSDSIGSHAEAMVFLADHGLLEITYALGRVVIARPTEKGKALP